MFTCRDGKGGELSSQASKMLYKPPRAVYIASYKVPLDQSDRWKLFIVVKAYHADKQKGKYERFMSQSLWFGAKNGLHTFVISLVDCGRQVCVIYNKICCS